MTGEAWKQAPLVEATPAWMAAPMVAEEVPQPLGTFGVPLPRDIVTTPLPAPPPRKTVTSKGGPSRVVMEPPDEFVSKAAEAGVVYDTGARKPTSEFFKGQEPYVGRKGLSFAVDPTSKESQEWLSKQLTNHFYGDAPPFERRAVHVRVGDQTGEIEFLDPNSKRWTMVNPVGLDLGDISGGAAGTAVAVIPEIAGAFLGAKGKGGAKGPIAAGASGALVGELARIELGRAEGVNAEVSGTDEVKGALKAAGISAASGGAMVMGLQVLKGLRNFIKGNIFTKEQAARWEANMSQARSIEDEIDAAIRQQTAGGSPENRFRLNLAQQTQDPELLTAADVFAKTPGMRQSLMQEQQQQRSALLDRYFGAKSKYFGDARKPAYEAGAAIQSSIEPQLVQSGAQSGALVQQAQAGAEQSVMRIPTGSMTMPGSFAANIVNSEREAFKAWASREAGKVQTVAGDIPIANTNLSNLAGKFDQELKNGIFDAIEVHKRSVVGPATEALEEAPEGIKILRESMGLPPAAKSKLTPIFDPETKWTFEQAWDAVSTLKDLARKAKKDFTTLGPDAATFQRLSSALEKDIIDSLAGSPAASAYDTFRAQYRVQKRLIEDTAKQGMIEKPDAFFHLAFGSKNRELNDQFAYLVPEGSQASSAYRNAIYQHYRDFVLADGRVNPARHAQWLTEYGDLAKPYLKQKDFNLLFNADTAEQGFIKAEAADKAVREKIAQGFGQQLLDAAPQDVVKKVWGAEKMFELRNFKAIAPKESVERLKGAVQDNIYRSVVARDGQKYGLNFKKLDDYLGNEKGAGHADVIKELFGEQYLSDLDTLRKALKLSQIEPFTVNRSGSAILSGEYEKLNKGLLMKMVRMWAGPLSHKAYALRQAFGVGDELIENQVFSVITNPDLLHQMVNERYLKPSSKKAAAILGQLGALSIWAPEPQ